LRRVVAKRSETTRQADAGRRSPQSWQESGAQLSTGGCSRAFPFALNGTTSQETAVSFAASALRTLMLGLLAGLSLPLAAQTQTPFGGTPIPLPGTFEAENFDNGGEGVAYHDNVAGNAGASTAPATVWTSLSRSIPPAEASW
jgi:hypothetical protein